jgi:hypothetical protein
MLIIWDKSLFLLFHQYITQNNYELLANMDEEVVITKWKLICSEPTDDNQDIVPKENVNSKRLLHSRMINYVA